MKPCNTMKIAVVLSMLALFCSSASAQGNLVVNGGFDTDASGWSITNINPYGFGGGYRSDFGNPAGSVSLYNDNTSANAPTASQEIDSLTPGTTYIISGDYWSGGLMGSNSLSVALDGITLFEEDVPVSSAWNTFSFDYTATSTSALLSLYTTTFGKAYGSYIDNIAMYATPEPSPSWLLFLGSGILFYVRNRKR